MKELETEQKRVMDVTFGEPPEVYPLNTAQRRQMYAAGAALLEYERREAIGDTDLCPFCCDGSGKPCAVCAKKALEYAASINAPAPAEGAKEPLNAADQSARDAWNEALWRKSAWNRITWPCDRTDFLAWRPSENGAGIEVLAYNYATLQIPSGCGLFYILDAPSLEAIGMPHSDAAGAALLAHEKAGMRDGAGESIQAERVKSRLLGIEDAISAFSDESLLAENKILIEAIDEEMVSCHLGVFNSGDDPRRAINLLMSWAQGLGEYEALRPIDEEDKSAWLKTPMLSSTALTHRSERDANAKFSLIAVSGLPRRRARPAEGSAKGEAHGYTSTACQHHLHERCRQACKFCGAAVRLRLPSESI